MVSASPAPNLPVEREVVPDPTDRAVFWYSRLAIIFEEERFAKMARLTYFVGSDRSIFTAPLSPPHGTDRRPLLPIYSLALAPWKSLLGN